MKTLFIDTHFKDIRIVLFNDGKIVDKKEVINKKNNSEYIFPSLIEVIDGIDIDDIIVVTGPGSFTGVRLGVTIAKTLAYSLNIPIKTISALECLAISSDEYKVAIDDGNGCYLGTFKDNFALSEPYKYVNNEVYNLEYKEYKCLQNYNYEKIYDFVKEYKISENPHAVKPIYIKKIGVEK